MGERLWRPFLTVWASDVASSPRGYRDLDRRPKFNSKVEANDALGMLALMRSDMTERLTRPVIGLETFIGNELLWNDWRIEKADLICPSAEDQYFQQLEDQASC